MALSRLLGFAIPAAVSSLACGGDGGGGPGPSPTTLALNFGDNQVGPAGQALTTPLSVRVTDQQSGQPVANVPVSWAVGTGGGSVSAASTNTDGSGIASVMRTLGPNAGTQTTTASRSGANTVTFTSIAQIQGATQIAINPTNSGNGQTDTVLTTLAVTYKVLVREQNNTAVQGVVVNWAAANVISGTVSSMTSTTNAGGIAEITHTFGDSVGPQAVTATVTGLIGSPVTFTSTATAGVAASIAVDGSASRTGTINSNVATPYAVRAVDAYGNLRSGVTVNWAAGGNGSLNPTQSTTGTNGIATSTRALGATPGTYTDTATSAGLPDTLLFTVTAAAAPQYTDVSVGNNFFSPENVTITRGNGVRWTWVGGIPHNVIFGTAGAPDNCPLTSAAGATCERVFPTAGTTFNYQCTIHPVTMNGSVTVTP